MKAEKDITDRILTGHTTISSGEDEPRTIETYQLPPELPASLKKRQECVAHLTSGVAQELSGEFELHGMHYPDKGEVQEITTEFSCKGLGCILKKCGLTLRQFDSDGAVISEMRAS